jgi:predicted alpha-1,6-mannanase (GH76 family)
MDHPVENVARAKIYRAARREEGRRASHNWYLAHKDEARVQARENRTHRREELREKSRTYYLKNRDRILRALSQRRASDDRRKKAAQDAVERRVKMGTMERGPCAVCGTTSAVEGHHEDYDRPLDVIWLCSVHHHRRHAGVLPKIDGGGCSDDGRSTLP